MSLHIGTSGWGYPSWRPKFYPEKLKTREFLNFYSTRLNAVEVNYTFRHLLTEKPIGEWLSQTPDDFVFAVKAHQAITHFRRLKGADEVVERFAASLQSLVSARRLGPVLFQLPPNFKADTERLREFLKSLPRGMRTAWEFRHESWFTDDVFQTLADRGAALCVAENDELVTPDVLTADFAYFRFRKSKYAPAARKQIADRLQRLSATREVFAFFKHEEDPQSATWAVDVLKMARPKAA